MPENPTLSFPRLSDPVTIDIGDGVQRPLRYSIASLRRLNKRFGRTMLGTSGTFTSLDETSLPELIFEGLSDDLTGEPPADLTLEQLLALPGYVMPYFMQQFTAAYLGSLPDQKKTVVVQAEKPAVN